MNSYSVGTLSVAHFRQNKVCLAFLLFREQSCQATGFFQFTSNIVNPFYSSESKVAMQQVFPSLHQTLLTLSVVSLANEHIKTKNELHCTHDINIKKNCMKISTKSKKSISSLLLATLSLLVYLKSRIRGWGGGFDPPSKSHA